MSDFKKTAEIFLLERFGVEPQTETPFKDELLSEGKLTSIIETLSEEQCEKLDCFIKDLNV